MPHGPRLTREEFEERQQRKLGRLSRPKRGWRPRWWTTGNTKLGVHVGNFNLVAGRGELGTCPGATGWCNKHCYAKGGWYVRKKLRERREYNVRALREPGGLERFVREMNEDLKRYRQPIFRLHGSGDFYAVEYVDAWVQIAQANPGITFWTYSHSWRVPELREALERFRALPNVSLYASVDPDTEAAGETPPEGWPVAAIRPTKTRGLPCPYTEYRRGERVQPNCLPCGFCPRGHGNVLFYEHDNRPNGLRKRPLAPGGEPAPAVKA